LVSGADSGLSDGKPHGVLPAGIADFVASGIPPAEALASATSVAAEKCGLGPRKGRLRAGYDADVLIVDGDPLADISALERVRAVYVGGVLAT
jgi:imidazolonepropionase-like amidohydrolase